MNIETIDDFEWDAQKNAANLRKHGISFEAACGIFESFVMERTVHAAHSDEARIFAIGMLETKEVVVIYAQRHPRKRIISARRAKRRERRDYALALAQGHDA